MNPADIARRAREIREAEERAMFGRPASGADDDLDGDLPRCPTCGDPVLSAGLCFACAIGIASAAVIVEDDEDVPGGDA